MRSAEYPAPERVLLHISDTHLRSASRLYGRIDAAAQLSAAVEAIECSRVRPDVIVFTGDLADHGEPEAYAAIRGIVDPLAERLGAPVVWVMGNHDDRAAFRRVLLDESGAVDPRRPVDRVDEIDGLRIVSLDTTVPALHHGEVSDEQLAWLADVLATPAPLGTILAMHHPPVPSVLALAASVELRDQARLAAVLRGADVRAILAGHLHYSTFATFAGIPVSVAAATCYTQDLTVPAGGMRPHDAAQSWNLVHLYDETVVHSVVALGATEPLAYTDAAEARRLLAAAGVDPDTVTVRRRTSPPTEPIPLLR